VYCTGAQDHDRAHHVIRSVHWSLLLIQFQFELLLLVYGHGRGRIAACDHVRGHGGRRLIAVQVHAILFALAQPRLQAGPHNLAGHAKLQPVREQNGQRYHDFHRLGKPVS
jgi:hypothetical protein